MVSSEPIASRAVRVVYLTANDGHHHVVMFTDEYREDVMCELGKVAGRGELGLTYEHVGRIKVAAYWCNQQSDPVCANKEHRVRSRKQAVRRLTR